MGKRLPSIQEISSGIRKIVGALFLAVSPMALLLFIVGFIMLLDNHNAYQRLRARIEEEPLTAEAAISFCNEESNYCFVDFTDARGETRFGKLEWRYYPKEVTSRLATMERGDILTIRYAAYRYEERIVLAGSYPAFLAYNGYFYEEGGIMLACWLVLLFFPEVMLYALVDDIPGLMGRKWKAL